MKLGRSVRFVCNVNVVDELFVWCRLWLTPVEGSLFQVSKPVFQGQSLKVVGAVGLALRRVPVNSVVCKSVMFSNVIVDSAFPCCSFVFSQSSCEVSASLTNVGGMAVRADNINWPPLRF